MSLSSDELVQSLLVQGRARSVGDGASARVLGVGPVVYWMSRDQRARDHWGLVFAQAQAIQLKQPLVVVFCLASKFLGATRAQFDFMEAGLLEVRAALAKKRIPLVVLEGVAPDVLPEFLARVRASVLVCDFDPLRLKREWQRKVIAQVALPCFEVDSHNIVPCWIASPKQEFGAYTLRPKLKRLLPRYMGEIPKLKTHPFAWAGTCQQATLGAGGGPAGLSWAVPGETVALKRMTTFLTSRGYDTLRNDPNVQGQSGLSPYLHFGQLSAQRLAWEVTSSSMKKADRDAYLEELIVRRELSDNFCYYNNRYDEFEGFPNWARKTLDEHRTDPRAFLYRLKQFEAAETHDELWNAAQKQMVVTGKMHGYLRMYWAKKILEWTKSPEEALEFAITLNDRYSLDGRDPNGYAGIAWSIGGVHDRAWGARPVFGKVRYMSAGGCKSKFDVRKYVARFCRFTNTCGE